MTTIDPSTALGKVRLRIGDWADVPILPDAVILAAIEDCNGYVPRAASLCAQYVLAVLTRKVHRKLPSIETWSNEQFKNYVEFIKTTILNPHLMPVSAIPYVNTDTNHPLIAFVEEWNEEFAGAKNAGLF